MNGWSVMSLNECIYNRTFADPVKELTGLGGSIPREALYRCYYRTKSSEHPHTFKSVWERQLGDEYDYPLEIATRFLRVQDCIASAEELVRVWGRFHEIELDEDDLDRAVEKAVAATFEARAKFRLTKTTRKKKKAEQAKKRRHRKAAEEKRPMNYNDSKLHIEKYLKQQPGRPHEIADALGMDRKAVGMQLLRMKAAGKVNRTEEAVYSWVSVQAPMHVAPLVPTPKPAMKFVNPPSDANWIKQNLGRFKPAKPPCAIHNSLTCRCELASAS